MRAHKDAIRWEERKRLYAERIARKCAERALAGSEAAVSIMARLEPNARRMGLDDVFDEYHANLRKRFH